MHRIAALLIAAATVVSAVAFTPVAYATAADVTLTATQQPDVPPADTTGQVAVAYYAAGGRDVVEAQARQEGASVEQRADAVGVVVVDPPTGVSADEFAGQMDELPGVRYAEPVRPMRPLYVPNDAWFTDQWGLMRIHMPTAWEITRGVPDVTVAVVDTGFDFGTADQPAHIDTVNDRDFTVSPASGTAQDDDGHGTHTAGIVAAATNNSIGVAGVAPDVTILPIRVLDGYDDNDVEVSLGIKWAADHGADVINLSLGGPEGSTTLRDAIDYALSKGCVVVAASGNEADDAGYTPGALYFPAAYPEVIAVGAIKSSGGRAGFSQYGPALDLVAPGDAVLSITPNDSAGYYSGTSQAAPHVSAVAALLRSAHTTWTASNVEAALMDSAEDLGAAGRDDLYGYGLVRADRALDAVASHLTFTGPGTTAWGGSATVSGTLSSDAAPYLAGQPVTIQARPAGSSTWASVASTTTGDTGSFSARVWPKKRTQYRAHFGGVDKTVQGYSAIKTISPRAALTAPGAPSVARRGVAFTSVGYVKPRHARGARSVSIKCYKWDSADKQYRFHHAVSAVNTGYSTTRRATRWAGRVTLSTGKWMLVARVPADSLHAKTSSAPRYVTVR